VIVAAQALRAGSLPGLATAGETAPPGLVRETMRRDFESALVLCAGVNQQASGAVLRR